MTTTQPAQTGGTDGAAILDAVHAALTRYVVMPSPHATDAVVLWIAATHAQPAWAHAPRLVIRAPERRCGKSRLLDIVEATVHDPLITVNASPSAVYRSITPDPPVILMDEADTIFGAAASGNEDLRGLLNAGHQRDRPTIRYDAATKTVERIPTFAMAALAGIGAMPDTIEDRAVVIHMRRRAGSEKPAPYRTVRDRVPLRKLADQVSAWLRADMDTLEQATPALPVEDRAADTWEPLIIVADHAGGDWPQRARQAAVTMTAEAVESGEMSDRLRALLDCRPAFGAEIALPTSVLITRLNALPESGWGEAGPGGLTAKKLGSLLREYGIRSKNLRLLGGGQFKGYQRADFVDAWDRYCPPEDDPDSHDHHEDPTESDKPRSPSSTGVTPSRRDGSIRPRFQSVPGLTCGNELGTDGTDTPLKLVHGEAR